MVRPNGRWRNIQNPDLRNFLTGADEENMQNTSQYDTV
jgi:hypothetical protein